MILMLMFLSSFVFAAPTPATPVAYPVVGDFVLYEGCTMKAQKCVPFQREQEILAYEKTVKLITILQRYREEGQGPQAKVRKLHENAFSTPAKFRELEAKCHGRDAHYEYALTEITVPAGSFKTCKLTLLSDGSETYIADVPFAFVKVVSPQLRYELNSYRNGFGTP